MAEFDLSNYQRTWKLKQLTEMIHFQADEPGAILRASEVKPKLDRFLVSTGTIVPGDSNKEWYTARQRGGGTDYAFHYKMTFSVEGEGKTLDPNRDFGKRILYLGNICNSDEKDKKKTKSKVYTGEITLKITSPYKSMIDSIGSVLPYFFALHGFGARSGKGYGSFSLVDGKIDFEQLKKYSPLKTVYLSTISITNPLADIWAISCMMKSGLNYTWRRGGVYSKDYYKGGIIQYFLESMIGSDKAFIKQNTLLPFKATRHSDIRRDFPNAGLVNSRTTGVSKNTLLFVRIFLGLADNYAMYVSTKKYNSDLKATLTGNVSIKMLNDSIKRCPSFVSYRVIQNGILLIPRDIPEKLFDQTAEMEGSERIDTKPRKAKLPCSYTLATSKTGNIKTPNWFDIVDFLDWFVRRFNTHVGIHNFKSDEITQTNVRTMRFNKL